MKIYTSQEILDKDDLYDIQELDSIYYAITDNEWRWVEFVTGRYEIADYIRDNTEAVYNEETKADYLVLTIDPYEISKALDDDCEGFGKAVMLSDDAALQKIIFWVYTQ